MDMELDPDSLVTIYFENKFSFAKNSQWLLPDDLPDLTESQLWSVDSLTALKQKLNFTKSLLNDKGEEWHSHTASINKASFVISAIKRRIKPELLTQAWCKFYEILCNFDFFERDTQEIKSLHVCEAPGAFISALNYFFCLNHQSVQWQWIANTLNPYFEGHSIRNVVVDDRLLFHTLKNWHFGKDNTGDITRPCYIDDVCGFAEKQGKFNLVTADGSFDCLGNPGEQEILVSKLQFSELLTALHCLLPGGSLVIKKFTFFECVTITQLFVLNCVFDKVYVFKPFTSRPSNSEVYVVCTGFEPSDSLSKLLNHWLHIYRSQNSIAVYPKSLIPTSFLEQLEACSLHFSSLQIRSIEENISLYPLTDETLIQHFDCLKRACSEIFIQKYPIIPSPLYDACKLYSSKKKNISNFFRNIDKDHKSIYFMAVGDTFDNIQKGISFSWQEKLLDVEKRINTLFPMSKKRVLKSIEWVYPWKEIRKKMQSKNVQGWITTGKKINCIENSKFCYPVILYLWNQVSRNSQIDFHSHSSSLCYFPLEEVISSLKDTSETHKQVFALSSTENDPLLECLKKNFTVEEENHLIEGEVSRCTNLVYMNATILGESLHQECATKKETTELISKAFQILEKGDDFVLCIQSMLSRYSAGLAFMIISLFEKFTTVLPDDIAPAASSQIWIFRNFQNLNQSKVVNLLSEAMTKELDGGEEVVEIIPVSSLCGGLFHKYLIDINNDHLLQRIKSFIKLEKVKNINL